MREHPYRMTGEGKGHLSTGFPLFVIGSAMLVIIAYLVFGAGLLASPPITTKVYVQVAKST